MIDTKYLDQVNELAHMVCVFKDCAEPSCIAKGCGAVWIAEQILKAGWVKQKTCTKDFIQDITTIVLAVGNLLQFIIIVLIAAQK